MTPATTKPTITIDVGTLFEDQWTGIPIFTRRLVQALLRHGGAHVTFMSGLTRLPADKVLEAVRMNTGTLLREFFQRQTPHDRALADPSGFLLYPSVKTMFAGLPKEASVIHDLSTLFMPENHEASNVAHHLDNFSRELATDDVVFCASDATRSALVTAFPSVTEKVRVLYQYVDWPVEFEAMERNAPRMALGRYAVVLGTLEPRKNLGLLLQALQQPALARSRVKFVVIGRKGWLVDEFLAKLPEYARQRLLFSGYVTEFVKYRLLANAEFLVFPSTYEGFGIPALEAMSLGKPVLAARTSSFPEVVGDAGVYFDPLSVTDFVSALSEIEAPKKLRELAPKALKQSACFGWERMAAPVADWIGVSARAL